MSEKLLEMKSICKQFSGNQVLFDIDFDLNYGEVHALIGENGAGKSTLIKCLAGVHQPDCGQIFIAGQEEKIHTPADAFQKGISTIHQEFNLVPGLDVATNIFLGRELYSSPGFLDIKKMYQETKRLLEQISADIDPTQKISELGVAEKQMVEICKAMSLNAKIVVMDEPTAVLSQKEIDKLFSVIEKVKKQNVSVIYISHRLEELPVISDRVSIMRDGHMVGQVPKQDISKELITRMMIGRDLSEQYPNVEKEITDVVLEVKNLSRKGVLHNISFELRKGEILGFSGLVGAGRTELARAVMGIDPIDEGEIRLDGELVRPKSALQAKADGIVMVPEERKSQGLVLSMSVEDNIALPYLEQYSTAGFINFRKIRQLTEDLIREFDIHPAKSEIRTQNMSGGNQQKVAIAKWVYEKHKVIVFDEPTRGVDVGAKTEIYRIMKDIAREGVGIIMISSELPEIIGMSDRVIIMKEGVISGEFDRKDLDEHRIMKCAF